MSTREMSGIGPVSGVYESKMNPEKAKRQVIEYLNNFMDVAELYQYVKNTSFPAEVLRDTKVQKAAREAVDGLTKLAELIALQKNGDPGKVKVLELTRDLIKNLFGL